MESRVGAHGPAHALPRASAISDPVAANRDLRVNGRKILQADVDCRNARSSF
jgi:hypothetical protein